MTTPRWCCRTARPPRTNSGPAARVLLLGALLIGLFPAAAAGDSAPDWLRAAAQQKLPEYDKDTTAVILLDETQVTVRDNGEIETRHRAAIRLLRPEARRDYSGVGVDFDKDTKISSLKAWTITSAGREMAVGEKEAVESGIVRRRRVRRRQGSRRFDFWRQIPAMSLGMNRSSESDRTSLKTRGNFKTRCP